MFILQFVFECLALPIYRCRGNRNNPQLSHVDMHVAMGAITDGSSGAQFLQSSPGIRRLQ
jgi:hypothetical protein